MALVRERVSGFYDPVDGSCEVFAIYDDVTHLLKDIAVVGNLSRFVDIEVDGTLFKLDMNSTKESKFDISSKNIRFVMPAPDDDITVPEQPTIVCHYYSTALKTRAEVDTSRGR